MANNATINDGDDDGLTASTLIVNNGSSLITQDQFETLVNLLHNSSLNQYIISAVSNRVGSSSFTSHPPLNDKLKYHSLAYKCYSLKSWIIDPGASYHTCSSSS